MTEDAPEPEPPAQLETYWRHIPSVYSDGAIGSARASGLHRIVMGEVCFNINPEADRPASRPVLNLIMTNEAIRNFITYLQTLEGINEG